MKKITLKNHFHGTTATFIPQFVEKKLSEYSGLEYVVAEVSQKVQQRVARELCGHYDCMCKSSIESYDGEGFCVLGYTENNNLRLRIYGD